MLVRLATVLLWTAAATFITSAVPSAIAQKSGNPQQSAWVKLCEATTVQGTQRQICLTHHERLDGNTGNVIVSVALREVEGAPGKVLMAMVPLGVSQRAGLRATIYPAELWDKVSNNERVDDSKLRPFSLTFTLCHQAGCTAEIDATSEILSDLRTGGGMLVFAMNAEGKPVAFPVPLNGFREAELGPPVDNAAYTAQRKQLMDQLQKRRDQLAGVAPTNSAAPSASAFRLGRRIALVVGNSNYKNASPLENPKNDARAVAAAFRRLGFVDVIERIDVDLAQLNAALKSLGDKATDADWAVIYFAGHGIQVDGNSYVLPTDVVLERASHITDEAVSVDRLLGKVAEARQLRLVILDSCRNNPFVARMIRSGATRSLGRGLAPIEPSGGVLVAYASRDGQLAEDGQGANSPFATALVRHLEEPGLEIALLFRRVRDTVLAITGGRQEPFTYGSLPGESYYFKAAQR